MSDFSDRPFVAGSLIGLRAFSVDSLGRLHGPSFRQVFTPSENVAACHASNASRELSATLAQLTARLSPTAAPAPPSLSRSATKGHALSGVGCTCGFYAYFDGSNLYADRDRVSALVEGYGVCTVGTRGFRAEKARLVALVLPEPIRRRQHPGWYDRLADYLGRREWGAVVSVASGFSAIGLTIATVGLSTEQSPLFALLALVALVLAAMAGVIFRADFHGIDRKYPSVNNLSRCHDHQPERPAFDAVRTNYPDVPTYPTVAAALKAHPLTLPTPVTPETDDNFWTRSAS